MNKTKLLSQEVAENIRDGYCCSEALVVSTTELYAPEIPKQLAHAASTGLCGGMGGKQATCGVFTGGAVAIGLVMGNGEKKDKRIKQLSAEYHQLLKQHAGGEDICHKLRAKMGDSNVDGSQCHRLSIDGGELLQSVLNKAIDESSS